MDPPHKFNNYINVRVRDNRGRIRRKHAFRDLYSPVPFNIQVRNFFQYNIEAGPCLQQVFVFEQYLCRTSPDSPKPYYADINRLFFHPSTSPLIFLFPAFFHPSSFVFIPTAIHFLSIH